jgi:hypothetical protein
VTAGASRCQRRMLGKDSVRTAVKCPLTIGPFARENERDLAEVPDELLTRLEPVLYTDPINAAIRAMRLE